MIIRTAQTKDAPAIAEIWNAIIRDTTVTFTTELKTIDALEVDIQHRKPAFLVAEKDGQVIGFSTYFPFRGGPGYALTKEHSIMLAPEARGLGAGRALMNQLEAIARDEGVHSLWAGVSGENPAGVKFHDKLGYQSIARLPQVGRKFDRWIDLVLMQKIL